MKNFRKRTAIRIGLISVILASLASPVAWWWTLESAEEAVVALAEEESGRLLHRFDAIQLDGPNAKEHARLAAQAIAGGLFDIAEIYDQQGQKLAVSTTAEGKAVEAHLPMHHRPDYGSTSYQSIKPDSSLWLLRVFVPLRAVNHDTTSPITGYFEGVRVMPVWQQHQIFHSALTMALMVGLASLACGAVLYPVVINLSRDNVRKAREVLDSHIAMMEALGRAIAKRDSDTGAHNYRVAWTAAKIAERMGLSSQVVQPLIVGSFLHDVGKIGIPDAILLKPGRLDEDEMRIMRTHVDLGEKIVSGIGWLDRASDVVASHHEKWNGSGYPRGLQGDAIPIVARIFAVADVFDALCSRRPYKEPMAFDDAMAILERDTGTHFDPEVMAAFRSIARDVHQQLSQVNEDQARAMKEERVRHHFGM